MIFQNKDGVVAPLHSIHLLSSYDDEQHVTFIRAYANEEDAMAEQIRLMTINQSLIDMDKELTHASIDLYRKYLIDNMIDFIPEGDTIYQKLWLTEQVKIFEKYKQPITKDVQTRHYREFLAVENLYYSVEEVPL